MGWILKKNVKVLHFSLAMSWLVFYFAVITYFQVIYENSTEFLEIFHAASLNINYLPNHSVIVQTKFLVGT